MRYCAKSDVIEAVKKQKSKQKSNLVVRILLLTFLVILFFSVDVIGYYEKAKHYDDNPDSKTFYEALQDYNSPQNPYYGTNKATEEKEEAISLAYALFWGMIFGAVLLIFLIILAIRKLKKASLRFQRLQESFLEIDGDTLRGTSYLTPIDAPEAFTISLREITSVQHRYDELNLILSAGEKRYQCLSLQDGPKLSALIKERMNQIAMG